MDHLSLCSPAHALLLLVLLSYLFLQLAFIASVGSTFEKKAKLLSRKMNIPSLPFTGDQSHLRNPSQNFEAMRSTEEHKERIIKLLGQPNDDMSTIFLVGETGIGKTWMAREISKSAIDGNLCYASLWVTVTEEFDTNFLYQAIAHQLSPSSITEELEDEEEIAEQEEVNVPDLKKMLQAKLKKLRRAQHKGEKYLLLVLDNIAGNKMKDKKWNQLLKALQALLPEIDYKQLKLLITLREIEEGFITEQTSRQLVVKFDSLSSEESLILLGEKVDEDILENQVYVQHCQAIAEKSMGLPAAITIIADTLNFINRHDSEAWKSALEEAANYPKVTEDVNPLVFCAYDMLPGTVLQYCFWYSMAFFSKYGSVHYNELIAHWIIEGYFDPFEHIEEAYKKGHKVLMELIDRSMLKRLEGSNNIIVLEGAALNIFYCCPQLFSGMESLRLPFAFEKHKCSVQGRTIMMDGMIKTLRNPRSWKEVSTLLIDGSHLCREVHEKFLTSDMKGLEFLAIFNPWMKSLTLSSFGTKLLVLVLRNCDLLEKINHIQKFENLTVLEISGANCLKSIPDELFYGMTSTLRSLNLSGLQIEKLPSSFYELCQVRLLILKGCSRLKELQSLKNFSELQILDLSGTSSLSFTQEEGVDKSSNSKEKGCGELEDKTLPSETQIDISNTPKLAEIENKSFEHLTCLCSLNLSNTKVKNLTWLSNLTNLRELFLRDCVLLENLPKMEGLTKLEVLDLSGSIAVRSLQVVEKLCNLQKLLLSGCLSLQQLPPLTSLVHLKVLNPSKSGIEETPLEVRNPEIMKEAEEQLPDDVNSEHCDIFKPTETLSNGKMAIIVVNGTKNLQLLKDICKSEELYLEIIPIEIMKNSGNGDEFMFRDIYFRTKQVPCPEKDAQFLEIRGFNSIPAGLKDILKHTEYISLTENVFMKSFSELAADSLTKVRGCWLERCLEMNSIFCKQGDDKLSQELKILWVSNLPKLVNLYNAKLEDKSFQNLTLLHLDCCPQLKTVFTSSHFPGSLEILQITFCDSLQTVFEQNNSDEHTLSNLRTLVLVGLPELTIFGASLRCLKSPEIIECPKLQPLHIL